MADWSKNNRACKDTWFTLFVLNQHKCPFPKAGDLKMSQLAFWAQAASPEMRVIQAKTLSIQLDNNFRLIRGANYEKGKTTAQAVKQMQVALGEKDGTIAELAEVVDAHYLFLGETVDEIA